MPKQKFKLGDAVAKLTKALHIPHCEKCERRRLILNEIQKLGVKETVKRLKAVGNAEKTDREKEAQLKVVMEKLRECCDE